MAMRVHKTARAIIARHGAILTMKANGSPAYGLPGGHLLAWEQPLTALLREIREEVGAELSKVAWVAKIEALWDDGQNYETMDLYEAVTWPDDLPLVARESHLTAQWVHWRDLAAAHLRPDAVRYWAIRAGMQA